MISEDEFNFKLEEIKEGKNIFDNLIQRFKIEDRDSVILFPHIDEEINAAGCILLPMYIKKRNPNKVIVLFVENAILKPVKQHNILWISIKEQQVECLLAYYSLCDLGCNFIVMSLTKPYGRFGEKVIKRNNITLKEVIIYCIYRLSREEINEEDIKNI